MGNSVDSRVNILAKNWIQINPSTYKNTITDELIDAHQLYAHNQEQLSYNNSLLIKRAAINHPNVVKLIYFHEQAQNMAVCNNKIFKHKIYTEHSSSTLAMLVTASEQDRAACNCCSVMNGIGCLVEKYGYFGVNPAMVFFVNSVGLSKLEQKRIAKVWINEDIRINHAQLFCNEQEMCFHLYQLYNHFIQKNFCSKIDLRDLSKMTKFKDFFEHIYAVHKKVPSSTQIERKRMISHLNSYQASKILRDNNLSHQNHNIVNINSSNAKPISSFNRQPVFQKSNNPYSHFVAVGNQPNFIPQQQIARPKAITVMDSQQKLQKLFLKGENKVKQLDLQESSAQKIEKNKINFSYTDSLATPKHNKSFQQLKTTKFNDSYEQLTSVPFLSANNKKQGENKNQQINKRRALPVVSFFSSNPTVQVMQTTPQILQSTIPKDKQVKQQQHFDQQSLTMLVEQKQEKKLLKPSQQSQVVNISLSSSVEQFKPEKAKKQVNLKLQKCFEIECNIPLQVSAKSIDSNRQKPTNTFEIVSEYRFSFEPQAKIPSIQIAQSQQFRQQSIEMSIRKQAKERINNTSKFYKQFHPQIAQSIESQKITFDSNHLIPPSAFRPGSTRKGSLPASHPHSNNRQHNYVQKLQHLTKGITNSINSIHSNGTKKSITSKSERREEEEMLDQANYYVVANPYYRTGDESTDSNAYIGNQIKREPVKKRSSELESYYSENDSLDERKKVQILQKINNTEKILEQNKKKLEKLQLEKDLEMEKDMIKKEMESLLKNNMMVDESHRIKEKVKHKKATFAELKAEASKILNDLNL